MQRSNDTTNELATFQPVRRTLSETNISASRVQAYSMVGPHRTLYIGGKWVNPAKGKRFDVICPADERVIGSIHLATKEDVDAAVESAR